ncbi:hypothetical protein LSTR_LSTR005538 [Laodelphax striatellus]|uniref:Uncharacterized protein n=1 Tax=Laodelphax striatellus TaxID=195883 RepID=A0A482WX52_LAOST|nr:hypothetical protein LSTR_LSTR005538 [Laodelphax striatellus]
MIHSSCQQLLVFLTLCLVVVSFAAKSGNFACRKRLPCARNVLLSELDGVDLKNRTVSPSYLRLRRCDSLCNCCAVGECYVPKKVINVTLELQFELESDNTIEDIQEVVISEHVRCECKVCATLAP